jgi:hypothetical protein
MIPNDPGSGSFFGLWEFTPGDAVSAEKMCLTPLNR